MHRLTTTFLRHTLPTLSAYPAPSTMRLYFSPLAILTFAPATASAWSAVGFRSLSRHSTRIVPATVLNGYATTTLGETSTESFRLSFTGEGDSTISPWHDIPLYAGKLSLCRNMRQ